MKREHSSSYPRISHELTVSRNRRAYRNPGKQWVGWAVVILATGLMATALALAIVGALNIYEGHPKPDSLDHWKTGTGLMVLVWGLEVIWACFLLLPSQRRKDAFSFHAGTTVCISSRLGGFLTNAWRLLASTRLFSGAVLRGNSGYISVDRGVHAAERPQLQHWKLGSAGAFGLFARSVYSLLNGACRCSDEKRQERLNMPRFREQR